MAENKKSFLLYVDIIHTIEQLTDDEAGKLLKHILRYVNDLNPDAPDRLTQITFEPIKQQLKRDLLKWTETAPDRVEKARKAGLASAKARELKRTKSNYQVENELNTTKSTVSVNVSVNDNVNAIDNVFKEYLLMRKRIKKPATNYAIELVKKKLDKIAGDNELLKIDILQQSITNSWSDVYPIKTNGTFNGTIPEQAPRTFKPFVKD
jgi:hypothetical protein